MTFKYLFAEAINQVVKVSLKDLKQLIANELNNPRSKLFVGKNNAGIIWLENIQHEIDQLESGKTYGVYDVKAFMPLNIWLPHLLPNRPPNVGEVHLVKNAIATRPLAVIPIKNKVPVGAKKQPVQVPMSSIADGWNLGFEFVQSDLNEVCRTSTNTYDWAQVQDSNYPYARNALQFWAESIAAAMCYSMGNRSKNVVKRAQGIAKGTQEYEQALTDAGEMNVYTSKLKLPFEII